MHGAFHTGGMLPLGQPAATTTPFVRGYEFSISNGQVTGMEWVNGARSFDLRLPANATFTVGASAATITETLTASWATQTINYALMPNQAGLYTIASEALAIASPSITTPNGTVHGYTFSSTAGAITGMQEVYGARAFNLPVLPTAKFVADGTAHTVTQTLVRGNAVETITYRAPDAGSIYALAADSVSYVSPGSSATPLWVAPFNRDMFTFDASGNVTQALSVRADGSTVQIPANANLTFTKLAPGFVLEAASWGSLTVNHVYHDGNADGIYTAIAHGLGATIDLVGLQAQLGPDIVSVL